LRRAEVLARLVLLTDLILSELRSSARWRCFPGPRERWRWRGRSRFAGTRNATKLTATAISSVVLGGSGFGAEKRQRPSGPLGAGLRHMRDCISDRNRMAETRL